MEQSFSRASKPSSSFSSNQRHISYFNFHNNNIIAIDSHIVIDLTKHSSFKQMRGRQYWLLHTSTEYMREKNVIFY